MFGKYWPNYFRLNIKFFSTQFKVDMVVCEDCSVVTWLTLWTLWQKFDKYWPKYLPNIDQKWLRLWNKILLRIPVHKSECTMRLSSRQTGIVNTAENICQIFDQIFETARNWNIIRYAKLSNIFPVDFRLIKQLPTAKSARKSNA